MPKQRAPRNRTITLDAAEVERLKKKLYHINRPVSLDEVLGRTIQQDLAEVIAYLPKKSVDMLFLDPPYNLSKSFNKRKFKQIPIEAYSEYLDFWLSQLIPLLKPKASVYICGDWRSSTSIHLIAQKYLKIINRITWEREKGRGAKRNWKNAAEDIWFCAMSEDYTFNVEAVKLKRRVIAPYKVDGAPKGWSETAQGKFRLTYPSNLWTDLTVPYWSMPENTDHPTQKPEKLLAKLILASTRQNDVVFDPFLGSGTTSVTAKKLGRRFFGVEIDAFYACLAEKRLELAEQDTRIQGYSDKVFWERNTAKSQSSR
jgi:site-specific DNA-methyltransferase (adenine-specific)